MERREACSFFGPSCVADLDPVSEQHAEMGHRENRTRSKEDGVCVHWSNGGTVHVTVHLSGVFLYTNFSPAFSVSH